MPIRFSSFEWFLLTIRLHRGEFDPSAHCQLCCRWALRKKRIHAMMSSNLPLAVIRKGEMPNQMFKNVLASLLLVYSRFQIFRHDTAKKYKIKRFMRGIRPRNLVWDWFPPNWFPLDSYSQRKRREGPRHFRFKARLLYFLTISCLNIWNRLQLVSFIIMIQIVLSAID